MAEVKGGELAQGYLVPGGHEALPALRAFLAQRGINTDGNADVYIREYKLFTVDDARSLRERAQSRAIGKHGRVFIVVAPSMTQEAQNGLLKTLEEPPAGATFFLVVPSVHTLLPTLRSRTQVLELAAEKSEGLVDVNAFLAAPSEKRLDMLKPLYMHDEDDERDLRPAVIFLQQLEQVFAPRVASSDVREGIESVYRARKYLMDKGALLKPLLEQVALFSPRL